MESKLPELRRARDYYLYDSQGRRWLDLWLDGGRAACGHRLPRLGQAVKSVIDRGLLAPYPSREVPRLKQLLSRLHPDFPYVGSCRPDQIPPLCEPFDASADWARWRAGWGDYRLFKVLVPILPLPGLDYPPLLLCREAVDTAGPYSADTLANNLSPLLAAALKRAVAQLLQQPPIWPPTLLAWFDQIPWWQRFGPYLRYRGQEQDYSQLWQSMAFAGVLLPPSPQQLGLIPLRLSEHDFQQLGQGARKFQPQLDLFVAPSNPISSPRIRTS